MMLSSNIFNPNASPAFPTYSDAHSFPEFRFDPSSTFEFSSF
jgi:hypothetical protein